MKVKKSTSLPSAETDMTPMIDMTFQLLTFFMFIMKVSDIDNDARIILPVSQIAKPPEGATENAYILQITGPSKAADATEFEKKGGVLHNGVVLSMDQFDKQIKNDLKGLKETGKNAKDMVVLVRADRMAKTDIVQAAIKVCQKNGLINYSLRGVVFGSHKRAPPGK
jgi:biopolymer transport protein ExbD